MNRSKSLLHFCSDSVYFGDPMPLYAEGVYHIYYTARGMDGLKWGHLTTEDFVHFTEQPMAIEPGAAGSLDESGLCTGCVFYDEEVFYLFYSAYAGGRYRMLSARSTDGVHFTKEYRELFEINEEWYRPDGTWRDPCVFRNPEDGKYWMVFCARRPEAGPDPLPGSMGCAVSEDLENWTLRPPIGTGHICGSLECPDVFRLGDKWALIYYWHDTRIRLADSTQGPWRRIGLLSPNHLDFMAAKTMFDGDRRILIGWVPRKDCDCSERIWGGNMAIPRELYLTEVGTPACRFIGEIDRYFEREATGLRLDSAEISYGEWVEKDGFHTLSDGFVRFSDAPDDFRLRFSVTPSEEETVMTFYLRMNGTPGECFGEMSRGYQVIFDFPTGMLRIREQYEWDQRTDLASIPLRRRRDGSVLVDLILEGDILEMVINDRESLVYRLMKHTSGGQAGLFAADGKAMISGWRAEERSRE